MPFYFNTTNQKEGDHAYNDKDYNTALKCYKKALKDLNIQTKKKDLSRNQTFIDAYAYVCGEIIITQCQIISGIPFTQYEELQTQWQTVLKYINLMSEKIEQLDPNLEHNTNTTQLNLIYTTLTKTCESTSDGLIDYIEALRQLPSFDKEVEEFNTTKKSIQWMRLALEYVKKTDLNLTSSFTMYLGLLHLHERLFKISKNQDVLKQMQLLLAEPPISTRSNLVSNHQLLEWQVHRLTIAMKLNLRQLEKIALQCQRALNKYLTDDQSDSCIVQEAKELLAKVMTDEDNVESLMDESENVVVPKFEIPTNNLQLNNANFYAPHEAKLLYNPEVNTYPNFFRNDNRKEMDNSSQDMVLDNSI